jgi:hypothetical protein
MVSRSNSFATVQLTPIPSSRRLYALECVGTVRLMGWAWRTAEAEGGGRAWRFEHRGVRQPVLQAFDAAGDVVGEYGGRTLRLRDELQWSGRELALRPDSLWRDRYVLTEDGRRLATIEGRAWGKRPLNVRVDGAADIGPGLLLFAVFVVGALVRHPQAVALARKDRNAPPHAAGRLTLSPPWR